MDYEQDRAMHLGLFGIGTAVILALPDTPYKPENPPGRGIVADAPIENHAKQNSGAHRCRKQNPNVS